MIVVDQLDAEFLGYLAEHPDIFDHGRPVFGAGAVFGREIRHGHEGNADGGIIGKHLFGVFHHGEIGHMSRNRREADLPAQRAHGLGVVAVKTGKLHAVIAHFFDFFKGSAKVCLRVLAD